MDGIDAALVETDGDGVVNPIAFMFFPYEPDFRPRLRADHRTREVARALLEQPVAVPALASAQKLLMAAGIDLLPRWAVTLHDLTPPPGRRPMIRAGMAGVGSVLRWALRDGSAKRARNQA